MHVRDLVELAAILSAQAPEVLPRSSRLSPTGLERYWSASKCRMDRWSWALKGVEELGRREGSDWFQANRRHLHALVEEILVSEILTRVWAGLADVHDRLHQNDEAYPVAHSVYLGHQEARHRVLAILVHQSQLPPPQARQLNRLRGRAERWTDLLLACQGTGERLSGLAFESQRLADFAHDLHGAGHGSPAWSMVRASLRRAFRSSLCPTSPNADLNAEIAHGLVSCFPSELLAGEAVLWHLRTRAMTETLSQAECLLAQLGAR